ncbi:MAG: hypothetical protein WCC86_04150 [Methanoregula sp.]
MAQSSEREEMAKDSLHAAEEHSLSGFPENEPDLYFVAKIKV